MMFLVQSKVFGLPYYPFSHPKVISHAFGEFRIYDFPNLLSGTYRWRHEGVDFVATAGTPVIPIEGGVAYFYETSKGYGKQVKVIHAGGHESLYGHLKKFHDDFEEQVGNATGIPIDKDTM